MRVYLPDSVRDNSKLKKRNKGLSQMLVVILNNVIAQHPERENLISIGRCLPAVCFAIDSLKHDNRLFTQPLFNNTC